MNLRITRCAFAVSSVLASINAFAQAALPAPTPGPLEIWYKAPLAGATVSGTLSADKCYVKGIGVTRVDFFLDSTPLNSDTAMADGMSCVLDTTKFANGTHQLKAVARNSAGATYSETVSINISNAAPPPPTSGLTPPGSGPLDIWWKAPAAGQTVKGTLSLANCYVRGTGVTRVDFFLGSTPIGSDTVMADGMSCVLDTTKFANGVHQLKAVARDAAGGIYNEVMSINIQNDGSTAPPPPPSSSLPSTGTRAIATFESLGLYWTPGSNPGAAGCQVKFRKAGDSAWREGLAMWYDSRNSECRGSLVHLTPNTTYEVQFNLPGQAPSRALTAKTWSETFPIAKTITVPSGSSTLQVTESGTPNGYVLYTAAPGGSTIDVDNAQDFNVRINASYVILRGFTLRDARINGVEIAGGHDIVIEGNDISNWGRSSGRTSTVGGYTIGANMDSGIHARCSSSFNLERLIVQNNRIHHPRYGTNSWSEGHPVGPNAVAFRNCGGNHVIRYNELYSEAKRYFSDVIGGESNFSEKGMPNADSDIYGNSISHAWDDAIEAEGANRNVRIWGNYIDSTNTGVATTATTVGPVYIWRNVWNRSRFLEARSGDSEPRGLMFKSGNSSGGAGNGRRYVFHNTLLQMPPLAGGTVPLGGSAGLAGPSSREPMVNTVSRNNVFHLSRAGGSSIDAQSGGGNDLNYDLFNGNISDAPGAQRNGIVGVPVYAPGNGWISGAGGLYQLAPTSRGYDQGQRIPNFNDGFTGAAPDMGAHEAGTPAMRFGVAD